MNNLPRRALNRTRRARRADDGAAMVEFAFVGTLFFVLLFGIIHMSVLLALKQNMTQAASEAARSAIAVVDDTTTPTDERREVALSALDTVVTEFDVVCGVTATCEVKIHECQPAQTDFAALVDAPAGSDPADPCMTTYIGFENSGAARILPRMPLVSSFEPDRFNSQSTVRLVPVPTLTP